MLITWSRIVRRWFLSVMALVLVSSIVAWFWTRETLPSTIRIAAGQAGGVYYRYAEALTALLKSQHHQVILEASRGSGDNAERIRHRMADLGIVQAGAVPLDGVAVIAPLAQEVVHVVVRNSAGIHSIADLRGKRVTLGLPDSGMRGSALQILKHYRLQETDLQIKNVYFFDLLRNAELDAAIVTTGIENSHLIELLATREFDLLPLEDAEALALKYPHFRKFEIPRGLYYEEPRIPATSLKTVATTSYLVCHPTASAALVTEMLNIIYDFNLQESLPSLIPRHQVLETTKLRWHPVARAYFDPFDQLGFTANLMESLAAIKELLVALGAAIFLCWDRWRRVRETEHQAEMLKLKNRLDEFLKQTIDIEREFLASSSPARLQELLDLVSKVKLQALEELTHEDLRGDRMFSIFLLQCGNLSQALQGKLWLAQTAERCSELPS
ncbi:MAG: TAXI family TRAP transporter solute-binding subunit [Planctomycetota bacterium]